MCVHARVCVNVCVRACVCVCACVLVRVLCVCAYNLNIIFTIDFVYIFFMNK